MTGKWGLAFGLVLLGALLFVGCAQEQTPSPMPIATPLPPISLRATDGTARASGEVVPARKVELGFTTGGRVKTVAVEVGDRVEEGALLVALDDVAAKAAVVQARAALQRAQAHLDELTSGPREEEIAVAEAKLAAAKARLAQLSEGARPEEIAAAKAELAAAQAAYQRLFSGPREEDRIAAETALANAEAALQQAQAAYDKVAWRNDVAMLPESRQLQEATNNYQAAKARYDALFAPPDPDVVAAARARIQQAQATLDRLQAPATESQIAEAEAQVAAAQAELDLLKSGARSETLVAAVAAVAEAEAAVQRAEADLASTQLKAPFAGTVTALNVNPGEMALPGQTVVTLADLDHLQVETTDLSERDVAQVSIGHGVTVYVEPLDIRIPGRVVRIAPQASVIGGDVVYPVTIELDEQPPGLRWGMSVEVEISAE